MRLSSFRPAAFLDRDGVLNVCPPEHHYVRSWEEFRWLPGAREALGRLRCTGRALVIVSNQRGISRGLVGWDVLHAIELGIQRDLEPFGAVIDAFYYCPHDLSEACDCRKPAPGLLLRAAAELGLDLRASVMIGDAETDVTAGAAAGCMTIRVGDRRGATAADLVALDLAQATELLLAS